MAIQIQLRRGTAAQWTAANPILADGEFALETDTRFFKMGDGVTAWNALSYGGISGPAGNDGADGADATYLHPRSGYRIVEHWPAATGAGTNGWTIATNSGAVGGNASAGSTNRFGLVRLDTSTSAVSAPSLSLGSGVTFVMGGYAHLMEISMSFSNLSAIAEEFIARFGYHNSTTSAAPTHGIYFEYDRLSSVNWRLVCKQGGTTTVVTSSIPVSVAWQELKIYVNVAGTQADFYVDGVLAGSVTTNLPNGITQLVSPVFQMIKSAGTTARVAYLDWAYLEGRLVNF